MDEAALKEFINDENNFKNIIGLLDDEEGSEYVDKLLPLMEPEKISFLLSKDERIVDKVYDLSRQPGPLQEVVNTIYVTKTNQALANKLDGNALIASLGHSDYQSFWFNSQSSLERLTALCSTKDEKDGSFDLSERTKRDIFIKELFERLHWDVPKEHVLALFVAFSYAVGTYSGQFDTKYDRIFNFLGLQLKRHGIEIGDLKEHVEEIRKRLPGAQHIQCDMTMPQVSIKEEMKKMEDKDKSKYLYSSITTGSYLGLSGVVSTSVVSVSGFTWKVART